MKEISIRTVEKACRGRVRKIIAIKSRRHGYKTCHTSYVHEYFNDNEPVEVFYIRVGYGLPCSVSM